MLCIKYFALLTHDDYVLGDARVVLKMPLMAASIAQSSSDCKGLIFDMLIAEHGAQV